MVLSKRVSLQWLPDEAEELTDTLVFTTPKDHFTDVRIYKQYYPYVQANSTPEPFEKIFQWVITGEEEEIAGTNKIRFNHEVNLQDIIESIKTGKTCKSAPDIGAFSSVEGSNDRKETGSMVKPGTGVVTEYVEIWRWLDPSQSTPEREVVSSGNEERPVETVDLQKEGFVGRIIRLGNWMQGVIYEKGEKEHPISVMRAFCEQDQWRELIRYGKHAFPAPSELEGFGWKRVE